MIQFILKYIEARIKSLLLPIPFLYKKFIFRKLKKKNGLYYKNEDLYFIEQKLKPTDTFFDIGSNIGVYAYIAEKQIPANQLYLFEPIPFLNSRLKKAFKKTNIYKYAVSTQSGKTQFKIPFINGQFWDTRGSIETNFKEDGEINCRMLDVETITFDEFIQNNSISKVDFIKVDVEGHELNVLSGAKKTLSIFKPKLLIEIEGRHHENTQELHRIINLILSIGYKMYYLDKNTCSIKSVETDEVEFILKQKSSDIGYINNYYFSVD